MEKQKNHRSCGYCRFYNILYIKSLWRFEKQKVGLCLKEHKIVSKSCQCELFKYRQNKEKIVTLEHIDIVVDDIKELEKLFYNSNY